MRPRTDEGLRLNELWAAVRGSRLWRNMGALAEFVRAEYVTESASDEDDEGGLLVLPSHLRIEMAAAMDVYDMLTGALTMGDSSDDDVDGYASFDSWLQFYDASMERAPGQ